MAHRPYRTTDYEVVELVSEEEFQHCDGRCDTIQKDGTTSTGTCWRDATTIVPPRLRTPATRRRRATVGYLEHEGIDDFEELFAFLGQPPEQRIGDGGANPAEGAWVIQESRIARRRQ